MECDWQRGELNPSKVHSLRVIIRWCHFLNVNNFAHLHDKLREKVVQLNLKADLLGQDVLQ